MEVCREMIHEMGLPEVWVDPVVDQSSRAHL